MRVVWDGGGCAPAEQHTRTPAVSISRATLSLCVLRVILRGGVVIVETKRPVAGLRSVAMLFSIHPSIPRKQVYYHLPALYR